jgi:hypothetical protein
MLWDGAITAGIYDRRNGVGPSFCAATILRTKCPLWVISGHRALKSRCLLYPQKRTLVERVVMSALCQKRTKCIAAKSPYWITSSAATRRVCSTRDAECLGRFEIDNQQIFHRHLHRKFRWLCASQDIVHITGRMAKIILEVCTVGNFRLVQNQPQRWTNIGSSGRPSRQFTCPIFCEFVSPITA